MKNFRAIFIDSEGTLRNANHQIDEQTKKMIKKFIENNIHFIVTTGLPRFIAKKICHDANASKYLICSNGADIYNLNNNSQIASEYLNREVIDEIYDLIKKDYNVILGVGDYEYSNCFNGYNINSKIIDNREIFHNENFYQCHISQKGLDFSNDDYEKEINEYIDVCSFNELSNLLDNDLLFKLYDYKYHNYRLSKSEVIIIIRAIRFSKLLKLKNNLLEKYSDLSIGNLSIDFSKFHYDTEIPWFSLNRVGVSKGNAILKMCDYLHLDKEEVVAIGNDYNDTSMVNACGQFICPNNSFCGLKKETSLQYDSNGGLGKILVKMYDGLR